MCANLFACLSHSTIDHASLSRQGGAQAGRGGGGGVLDRRDVSDLMHRPSRMTIRPSHPYNAGTEHVRCSPTRQTLIACTKREAKREVFGESHERVSCIPLRTAREADLHNGGQVQWNRWCTRYHAWRQSYDHGPPHPRIARTERVGVSPTRQTSLYITKREAKREAFGESRKGLCWRRELTTLYVSCPPAHWWARTQGPTRGPLCRTAGCACAYAGVL